MSPHTQNLNPKNHKTFLKKPLSQRRWHHENKPSPSTAPHLKVWPSAPLGHNHLTSHQSDAYCQRHQRLLAPGGNRQHPSSPTAAVRTPAPLHAPNMKEQMKKQWAQWDHDQEQAPLERKMSYINRRCWSSSTTNSRPKSLCSRILWCWCNRKASLEPENLLTSDPQRVDPKMDQEG